MQQSTEHTRGATMVVIKGDGELLIRAPSSVAGEMLSERTALNMFIRLIKIEFIVCLFF